MLSLIQIQDWRTSLYSFGSILDAIVLYSAWVDLLHNLYKKVLILALAAPTNKQLPNSLSVKFIYKVLKVSQKRRCDLTLEQAGTTSNKNDLYWLFELGEATQIQPALDCTANSGFVIFMTTALELLAGKKTWRELFADRVYKNSLGD